MTNKPLFLVISFFILSCQGSHPEDPLKYFDAAEEVTPKAIILDNELHGIPAWSMEYDHPLIAVVETRYLFNKVFYLIDVENNTLRKVVNYGRGDCEFNHIFLSSINAKEKQLTFLDNDRNTFYQYSFDSLAADQNSYENCPKQMSISGMSQGGLRGQLNDLRSIDDRFYIGYKDAASDLMYKIFDTKKDTVYHMLEYPQIKGLSDKEMKVAKRIFWGYTHVAPDKKKIALVAQPTLIEILDWNGEKLTRKQRISFYDYRFQIDFENNHISRRGFGNKEGFLLGDVTDNYIYVGYCGYTEEQMTKMGVFPSAFYMLVFDWDGNPVKSYKLKRGEVGFVAKEDDSGIYATSVIGESIDLIEYKFSHSELLLTAEH